MQNILKQFQKLNAQQQLELIKELEAQINGETKILSHFSAQSNPDCFYCGHDITIRSGFYSKQRKVRYKCKSCNKTFSQYTGTSVYNIKKKDQWLDFIRLMLYNKSIRYIAEALDLSTTTVFQWRHRVLAALEKTFTRGFKGIVEVDDVFMPLNQKGRRKNFVKFEKKQRGISKQQVAVWVMVDRYKTLGMNVCTLGRITPKKIGNVIDHSRINKDNIICSDMHRSISKYFRDNSLEHHTIKSSAKEFSRGIYHVNTLNSVAAEFKRWVHGNFINVSTKYLQNYLYYFEIYKILGSKGIDGLLGYSLVDNQSYAKSKTVESKYQEFLSL